MEAIVAGCRGLRILIRMNFDWLRFAVMLLIALYASSYVMLR